MAGTLIQSNSQQLFVNQFYGWTGLCADKHQANTNQNLSIRRQKLFGWRSYYTWRVDRFCFHGKLFNWGVSNANRRILDIGNKASIEGPMSVAALRAGPHSAPSRWPRSAPTTAFKARMDCTGYRCAPWPAVCSPSVIGPVRPTAMLFLPATMRAWP